MQAVLAFSLVVSSLISNPDLLLQTGDKAPPFSMRDLDGNVVSLRDMTGPTAQSPGKTIVLSFFATWCEPCKAELQDLRQIEKLWKTREVQLIHIGLSQDTETLLAIFSPIQSQLAHRPRFIRTCWGRRYGVDQLPHIFIINRDGEVAYQKAWTGPESF